MTHQLNYGFGGSQAYAKYYKHSGQVTLTGPLLGFAVGIPAAVLMGVLYAYGDSYIPIIYLNALLCAAFGAGLGLLPAWVMHRAKVRNVAVAMTVVIIVTLLGYYVSWVQWICVTIDRYAGDRNFTVWELATSPTELADIVSFINSIGTWSMTSSHSSSSSKEAVNVSGMFLTIIWIAEAATIVGVAIFLAKRMAGSLPFCESCDRWCDGPSTIIRTPIGDPEQLRRSLEAGDFSYVLSLRELGGPGAAWWQLDHHICRRCNKVHTLSVVQVENKTDNRGRTETKKKTLVRMLLMSPEQIEDLKSRV